MKVSGFSIIVSVVVVATEAVVADEDLGLGFEMELEMWRGR